MSEWFQPGNTPEDTQEGVQSPVEETTQPVPPTDWRANPYTRPVVQQASEEQPLEEQPPVETQPPVEETVNANDWYYGTPVQPQVQPTYTPPTPQKPPQKKRHNGAVIALAVVGIVSVVAMLAFLASAIFYTVDTPTENPSYSEDGSTPEGNKDAPSVSITEWADDDGGLSAATIIQQNMDSTVVIDVYQLKSPNNMYQYGFDGQTLTQAGAGSGIVMTADGYIITNWHVVVDESTGKAFERIDVTTHDGTVYEDAQLIGADESTGLAVIKVTAKDLTPAKFGDSSKLTMGARVITLGNAGGLHWSASQGIVSGLARDVYDDTGYSIKCLQTDAAINPGNSGGPLLNNQGQVVGINSAKIAAEGYEGLGFSIPINEAKVIIDDLTKYGYVRGRVEMGIEGYSVSNSAYQGFVISKITGTSSLNGTDARVGDLITAIDGVKIDGYGTLRSELAKHKAGDTVTISLLRLDSRTGNETTFTVKCTLKESKPTNK